MKKITAVTELHDKPVPWTETCRWWKSYASPSLFLSLSLFLPLSSVLFFSCLFTVSSSSCLSLSTYSHYKLIIIQFFIRFSHSILFLALYSLSRLSLSMHVIALFPSLSHTPILPVFLIHLPVSFHCPHLLILLSHTVSASVYLLLYLSKGLGSLVFFPPHTFLYFTSRSIFTCTSLSSSFSSSSGQQQTGFRALITPQRSVSLLLLSSSS